MVQNIPRVLPAGCAVVLDRASWPVPPIFDLIQKNGRVARKEMDRVFNNGIGMVAIVSKRALAATLEVLRAAGEDAYPIGEVVKGRRGVRFR